MADFSDTAHDTQRIRALEADAKRYRWLKEHSELDWHRKSNNIAWWYLRHSIELPRDQIPESIDAAIDSAMSNQPATMTTKGE